MTQTLTIPSKAIEYPIFSPNWGPDLDKPAELLLDVVSPYSRNMQVVEGKVQGRLGLAKLLDVALSGAIVSQPRLMNLAGTRFYLFCTPKDIYSLDYGNTRFDILTPVYTTGTIEVQAGTPTIFRGTGTLWLTNAAVGGFVKIGAGSVHTDSTWYQIASVDSDTQLTLTTAAPTTGAGSAYVLRKIFTGSNSSYWDWEVFDDDNLGRVVIMTNGVDKPHYWTGSGQATIFGTLPTNFTAAKYVDVFKNRILFSWCVVGGSNERQAIYNSGVADLTSWNDLDFRYLADEPDDIRGTCVFAGYHVVIKEKNA